MESKSKSMQGIAGALGGAIDKCSSHWGGKYFGKQLPLFSILNERAISQEISRIVENGQVEECECMIRTQRGAGILKADEKREAFVNETIALARKSTLAGDKLFMECLASSAEAVFESSGFSSKENSVSPLAVFGHAASQYELLQELGAKKESIPLLMHQDILKLHKVMQLNLLLDGLIIEGDKLNGEMEAYCSKVAKMSAGERTDAQSQKNIDFVASMHQKVQGVAFRFLYYLETNFGLVFVPQEYVKMLESRTCVRPEYLYHTESPFNGTSHSDAVDFEFGVPFLPLAHSSKEEFSIERQAVIRGLSNLARSLSFEYIPYDLSRLDKKLGKYMNDYPSTISSQLGSYSRLLCPVVPISRRDRDWSFPTFRFDLKLKEAFEKLLSVRRKELRADAIEDIETTLYIMAIRRKLYESYSDFEKQTFDARFYQTDKHVWGRIYRSIFPQHSAEDLMDSRNHKQVMHQVSLAILGNKRGLMNAKAMNDAGIEEIIGFRLPEMDAKMAETFSVYDW